jgi:hypothetical protein
MRHQHIIHEGFTLCGWRAPKKNEGTPCRRCALVEETNKKLETTGMVELRPKRPATLRYRVAGENYRLPLATRDKAKVRLMVPLVMRQVQRTGKPIPRGPQCYADLR